MATLDGGGTQGKATLHTPHMHCVLSPHSPPRHHHPHRTASQNRQAAFPGIYVSQNMFPPAWNFARVSVLFAWNLEENTS